MILHFFVIFISSITFVYFPLTGIRLPAHIWAVRDFAIGETEPDGLVEALAKYASGLCSNDVSRLFFHSVS